MIINNLEQMEKIVAKNSNLSWIGWDVVELKKSHAARTSKDGIYKNGIWYLKKTYEVTKKGWNIPDKFRG